MHILGEEVFVEFLFTSPVNNTAEPGDIPEWVS